MLVVTLYFFCIKSIPPTGPGPLSSQNQVQRSSQDLKRESPAIPQTSLKRIKVSSKLSRPIFEIPCALAQHDTELQLQSLCTNRSLCGSLTLFLQKAPGGVDECIGTLDEIEGYKHYVLLAPEINTGKSAVSLKEIIQRPPKGHPFTRLSHYDRLHLACSLATAVLQYNNTPWAMRPWRSGDIHFSLGKEILSRERLFLTLPEPHINVTVEPSTSLIAPSRSSSRECLDSNAILYSLALMMIELAYNRSIDSLIVSSDNSQNAAETELRAAKRLTNLVSREMGLKYGKVVKKCLGSHFANGCDLNDTDMQQEYYRDVINELESLERQFQGMDLGP